MPNDLGSTQSFILVIFIFGVMVGGFLNVRIFRIPHGASIVQPPSYCPNCKACIPSDDNIPLVSYYLLLGCRHSCPERILAPAEFASSRIVAKAKDRV